MEEFSTWAELFMTSVKAFVGKISESIPYVLGAILIFILGWLIAKLLSFLVARILKAVKFDKLADKIHADEFLEKANIKITPSKFVGKFVYWFIMLIVLVSASETLGWEAVSNEISKLIGYLPKILVAIVIFVLGTYFATFIRDIITGATSSLGISTGKIISKVVFYLLMIVITLTSLDQAGIDTTIITSNLLLILGAILAAAAISYGYASRDVLSNILAGYFGRNTYRPGLHIEVQEAKGEIISITTMGVTILAENGDKIIIPTKDLLNNQVKILK